MLRWWNPGLEPGTYTLRISADRRFEQKISLQTGDRLIVELFDDGNGGIAYRRALYGDEDDFRDGEKREGGPWRLTILGNQKTGDEIAGLGLMAAVESTANTGPTLEQVRPGWVDFRLGVAGRNEPASPLAPRWRERMTYPGPVWQLDAPRWPADPADPGNLAKPIVSAWWLGRDQVDHLADPGAVFDLDPAVFPIKVPMADGRVVLVEDFRLEDHYVEDQPAQPPRPEHCLVIRLAYPKGSPYFVDPDAPKAVGASGYEHRDYRRAGKYAGLFWPVNESQFEILRKGKLRLVAVDRLRGEAEKLGQKAEIKLERPRNDVKLPEPPRAIRP